MKKLLSLLAVLIVFITSAFAQERTVSGQIKDEKGNPVPFATIKIKGSTTGVAADQNGNFSIRTKTGDVLEVSAAGLENFEVTVSDLSTIDVVLKQGDVMKEVVVTALGIRRTRNQLPYSAQQVAGDEVSKTRTSNFVNNLSGKVSGLELRQTNSIGGSTNILVRGVKSITGSNQPLFVVDGVPFDNSTTNSTNQRTGRGGYDYGNAAADINPDDIQSVTVLKGAAASALYGSRGNNGVILITTKKGRSGLGISVNSGIAVGKIDKSTFAEFQRSYGGGYGRYYEDPSGFFLYRDINGDGVRDLVTPTSEDASYGGKFDPALMVYQWDAFDPGSAFFNQARPWMAAENDPTEFFENSLSSNQSIYVDGASDKGTFKLGYTRTDDKGILPNSKVSKNLVNFGATHNITDELVVGGSVNYSGITGKGRYGTGYDDKNLMTNFRQWWQTNVDVKQLKDAYFREKKNVTWNWADPTDLVPIYWDNPYFTRYENFQNDNRDRYFGNINLTYNINDRFSIMGRASMDAYTEMQEERQAVGSVTVSSYERFDRTYNETNFDLLLNYDQDLSEDFNLKALLGGNIRKQHITSVSASTNGGLITEKVYSLSNSANPLNAPTELDARREVDGVFAGATLSWQDMITLDATIRRDASSTLPEGNNVYYYPSVSAGFVFSRLLQDANWLTYGKLRGNYAQVGNDAPFYSTLDVYTIVPPFGSEAQSSVASTRNNPDLKPERTKSAEVGLEIAFLKNRLGFDITYYDAKTFDQILPTTVSTATGYSSKFLNAGTIQNKGIELSVFGTPFQSQDFSWTINLNWTRNRNKVVSLFEGSQNLLLATFQGGVSLNATLGEPYGTIRGSNFVFTEGQKTVNITGAAAVVGRYMISPTSNEVIGNPNPDWIGGINNTLKYKNLSLSFLIDMRKGGDVFSLDLYYGLATGIYPETAVLNDLGNPVRNTIADGGGVILPGVKPDGKPNDIRVQAVDYGTFGYRYNPAAGFIYDAGYVKLREVVLTYSIPSRTIENWNVFKGISLSLIARNLWIIDKNLPYADPEENISAGNLQGYQGGAYPTTRTLGFNASFKF
jgi:TonB-linked SusC/RagA family outer membrane protein